MTDDLCIVSNVNMDDIVAMTCFPHIFETISSQAVGEKKQNEHLRELKYDLINYDWRFCLVMFHFTSH